MFTKSPKQIYRDILNCQKPSFSQLQGAIYYGAAKVIPEVEMGHITFSDVENVLTLGFKVVDLMLLKDFDHKDIAAYSLAQQPVYELTDKVSDNYPKPWSTMLKNIRIDASYMMRKENLDFASLMVLVNTRRFCKRLPKDISDFIKKRLSYRVLYIYDWNLGENPSLKSRLQKIIIECHGLQILKYAPYKSYTKKELDKLLPEIVGSGSLDEHRLFTDIICSFEKLMTDHDWISNYIDNIHALCSHLSSDEDILIAAGIIAKLEELKEDTRMTDEELEKYWKIMFEEMSLHSVVLDKFVETHNLPLRRFSKFVNRKMMEFNNNPNLNTTPIVDSSESFDPLDSSLDLHDDFDLPDNPDDLKKMLDTLMKEGEAVRNMTKEQYAANEEWKLSVKKNSGTFTPELDIPVILESLKKLRRALNHLSDQGHATFHKVIKAAAERQFFGSSDAVIKDWLHTEKMHFKDFPLKKTAKGNDFGMSNEILRCDTDRTMFGCIDYLLRHPEYKDKVEHFLKDVESKMNMLRESPDFKMSGIDKIPWDAAHVFHKVLEDDFHLTGDPLVFDNILTSKMVEDYRNAVKKMDEAYWRYGDNRLKEAIRECNRQILSIYSHLNTQVLLLQKSNTPPEIATLASSTIDSIDRLLASL